MSLTSRLKQLEARIRPVNTEPEHHFDFDQFVTRLGLEPAGVRELSQSQGKSLNEAMCEMLGIDYREFRGQLRERVGLARQAWR